MEEKSQIIDLENQDFNFMMMISWSKPQQAYSSTVTSGAASNFRVFVAPSNTQSRIFRKSGSNLLHDRYRTIGHYTYEVSVLVGNLTFFETSTSLQQCSDIRWIFAYLLHHQTHKTGSFEKAHLIYYTIGIGLVKFEALVKVG